MYTRIKELRTVLGLSHYEFARKIYKTPRFIYSAEAQLLSISDGTVADICSVFGVNEKWLREGTGEMFSTSETIEDIEPVSKLEELKHEDSDQNMDISEDQIPSAPLPTSETTEDNGLFPKIEEPELEDFRQKDGILGGQTLSDSIPAKETVEDPESVLNKDETQQEGSRQKDGILNDQLPSASLPTQQVTIDDIIRQIRKRKELKQEIFGQKALLDPLITPGTIGERIMLIREREGLKPERFSHKIGVSKGQLQAIEAGKSKPSDELVKKIAVYFSVCYDWLVNGIGETEMEYTVDEEMVIWLERNPTMIVEIRNRMKRHPSR